MATLLESKLAHADYVRDYPTHKLAAFYQVVSDKFAVVVFMNDGMKLLHVLDDSFTSPTIACESPIVKQAVVDAITLIRAESEKEKERYLKTQGIDTAEIVEVTDAKEAVSTENA